MSVLSLLLSLPGLWPFAIRFDTPLMQPLLLSAVALTCRTPQQGGYKESKSHDSVPRKSHLILSCKAQTELRMKSYATHSIIACLN
mmetsp:Transcript_136098/g.261448  ORF Transcript_136098/g.261448 Transcript_136098/m.261448 type:complete len:86 (-) Transcript_136098:3-260(-)